MGIAGRQEYAVISMVRAQLAFLGYLLILTGCNCSEPTGLTDATVPRDGVSPDAARGDGGEAVVDGDTRDGAMGDDGGVDRDGGPLGPECVADEICGDGLDADCDGLVDEGCGCEPGETAGCFLGSASLRGVGACMDGTMVCMGSFEFGEWGPCEGSVGPSLELCDAAGVDEDCDGAPNDGCECSEGDPDLPCGSDVGACVAGVQRCVGGARTDCEGAVGPASEVCDGLDNDCDGSTDEGLSRGCGVDIGVCRMGAEVCADGVWGVCSGGVSPVDELCDALDNDCDGMTDESVRRTCGSDIGACVAGMETCVDGVFGACAGRTEPVTEICNGVDDDCDGLVDEDLTRACGTDVGVCVAGTESCVGGGFGACVGSVGPRAEVCDGALDENCDGTVDEGCTCVTGTMRPCGTDVGRCVAGSQTCDAAGEWGTCVGAIDPRTETCDGTDDDCDGMLDEGCECVTGATRSCGSDVGVCVAGTETCDVAGRWGACLGGTPPSPEVCNARDDDCDAMVDEGGVCPRFPPVAVCPGAQSGLTGAAISLTGSGSDPDGGPVTFAWTVVTAPVGSTAAPAPANARSTSFTPDVVGNYTLRMCVTDDELQTTCCTVSVSATPACSPPPAPTLTVCPTSWDRRPVVEFAPLPSGQTYELFFDGSSYATVATAGQNYHRPAAPLGMGGAPPSGVAGSIHARACLVSDPTCCAVSAAVPVSLIESCTTPVAPTPSNIVFSEYVINGDGPCSGPDCEAGEAIEITNLSNCPVALNGNHFGYCNTSCTTFRWMNFGAGEVIPPRGVYVAIRNRSASMCSYPFFGPNDPGLFGLQVSTLAMQGPGLSSGWFNNAGGMSTTLRMATGAWDPALNISSGTTLEIISPYTGGGSSTECTSIGFDAVGRCGEISAVATPTTRLNPNQLGRLWHPCDAVTAPNPATCM